MENEDDAAEIRRQNLIKILWVAKLQNSLVFQIDDRNPLLSPNAPTFSANHRTVRYACITD